MPYTKKPDEYDIFQYDGTNRSELRQWLNGYLFWPDYALSIYLTEDGTGLYLVNQGYAKVGPLSIVPGQYVVVCTKNRSGSASHISVIDDPTADYVQAP